MNTRSIYSSIIRPALFAWASVSLLAGAMAVSGAELEKTNPPAGASRTNSAAKAAPIEVPLSQFTIPASASEGRNPFFPESTLGRVVPNATNVPTPVAVALTLNGISKVGTKWFALINGRTFEAGEEGDVNAARGKIRVLCVSIRENGVTVEVNGNRQELKLKVY